MKANTFTKIFIWTLALIAIGVVFLCALSGCEPAPVDSEIKPSNERTIDTSKTIYKDPSRGSTLLKTARTDIDFLKEKNEKIESMILDAPKGSRYFILIAEMSEPIYASDSYEVEKIIVFESKNQTAIVGSIETGCIWVWTLGANGFK